MTALIDAFVIPIQHIVPKLPSALLTLVVGFAFIHLILGLAPFLFRSLKITRTMQQILLSIIAVTLWIGVLSLVLENLGLRNVLIALSGSVAVIGLLLAAGGNKLLGDVIAGVSLAKNRYFKIGQRIKIENIEGQIHSLDARKVRILDKKGNIHIIPNGKFDELIWEVMIEDKKE